MDVPPPPPAVRQVVNQGQDAIQDHAYDALRYLIMSRPKVNDIFSKFRNLRMEQAYTPADAEFGY